MRHPRIELGSHGWQPRILTTGLMTRNICEATGI